MKIKFLILAFVAMIVTSCGVENSGTEECLNCPVDSTLVDSTSVDTVVLVPLDNDCLDCPVDTAK